jgi:hypothetical protein
VPAVVVCAELVAPVANMLADAVAAGRFTDGPTPLEHRPARLEETAPDRASSPLVEPVGQMEEVEGERAEQGPGRPSGTSRGDLRSAVHAGPGPRPHRVHDAPVRPGGGGGRVGLARRRGRSDRRRPGGLRPLHRGPGRVQGPGRPGVPGRDRGRVRAGGLPAGPLLGGPVPAAGAGPADRHPGDRRGRDLRPGRLQRPPPARPEGDDVRSRAAPAGRPVAGRETGCGATR